MRYQNMSSILERNQAHDQLAIIHGKREWLFISAEDDVINELGAANQVGDTHAFVGRER